MNCLLYSKQPHLHWEISILQQNSSAFPRLTPAVPKWHSAPTSMQFLLLESLLGLHPFPSKTSGGVSSGDLTSQTQWDQGAGSCLRWWLFGSGRRSCYISHHLRSPPATCLIQPGGNSAYTGWATVFLMVKEFFLLWGHSTIFQPRRDFCQSKPTTPTTLSADRHRHPPAPTTSSVALGSCTTRQPGYHLGLQLKPATTFIL